MSSPPPPPERRDYRLSRFTREELERAARIYHSNKDAGQALGMAGGSFGRLCRKLGVLTPQARRRRELREQGERRRVSG